VFAVLLLGADQHVAQGISLLAQIPPTSLSGIQRYREKGNRCPALWLIYLAAGFVLGGIGGAFAAGNVSDTVLRWSYVLYLTALDGVLLLRHPRPEREAAADDAVPIMHWSALLSVGALAGLSSGFLGIGGGLAVTVGLSAGLRVPRHQAQLVSLALSLIPTTIPAAWVYWHQGWSVSWLVIAGVVLGLWGGTNLGARVANRIGAETLHRTVIGFVAVMAIYMTYKALD
jgi:uncharacterized membrane protein YfcA